MTPASLEAWKERLGLNKTKTAAALGITRTTLDRYLNGESEIPEAIALACAAIAHGVPPIK
jgi:plasmid maintenance system antidote protein VapI